MFRFQLWNEEEASLKWCNVSTLMTDGGKQAPDSNVSDNLTMVLLCVACLCAWSPLGRPCVFVHVLNECVTFTYTKMVVCVHQQQKSYGVSKDTELNLWWLVVAWWLVVVHCARLWSWKQHKFTLDVPEYGRWHAKSMFVQELVLKQRTEILHALCSSGSAEHLERVLDILLAQGELIWEDYQNIQVPGRALYTNARQLLDLVYTKGVDTCGLFLAALKQVLPEEQGAGLSFSGRCSNLEEKKEYQTTSTQTLLTQRPSLVSQLQGCIDGALEALVISGHFTSADCDEVRLPIHTPSQQVL